MNNKKFISIAATISIFILILVLILSPNKKNSNNTTINVPSASPSSSFKFLNLTEEKKSAARNYTQQIMSKLPLLELGYKTSPNIDIDINIFRLNDDPGEIVRLEITGISYINKDSNEQSNPNVTAFKEGYFKAIEMLESVNIDPKRLIFVYSGKEYVNQTAQLWLDSLKIKP